MAGVLRSGIALHSLEAKAREVYEKHGADTLLPVADFTLGGTIVRDSQISRIIGRLDLRKVNASDPLLTLSVDWMWTDR